MRTSRLVLSSLLLAVGVVSPGARAQGAPSLSLEARGGDEARRGGGEAEADRREQVPRLGLVDTAHGLPAGVGFVALSGQGTSARSENAAEGGVRLGLAPVSRLTIHGYAGRNARGELAPELAAQVRLLGGIERGGSLGVMAQYKAEGFSELGGELEVGVLGSLRRGGWNLTGNVVLGAGLEEEEEGEMDGEIKVRVTRELGSGARVGVEGQGRRRLGGPNRLAGGRDQDVLGGALLGWGGGPLVLSLSFGPSTRGVASGVGAYGLLVVAATVP